MRLNWSSRYPDEVDSHALIAQRLLRIYLPNPRPQDGGRESNGMAEKLGNSGSETGRRLRALQIDEKQKRFEV